MTCVCVTMCGHTWAAVTQEIQASRDFYVFHICWCVWWMCSSRLLSLTLLSCICVCLQLFVFISAWLLSLENTHKCRFSIPSSPLCFSPCSSHRHVAAVSLYFRCHVLFLFPTSIPPSLYVNLLSDSPGISYLLITLTFLRPALLNRFVFYLSIYPHFSFCESLLQ